MRIIKKFKITFLCLLVISVFFNGYTVKASSNVVITRQPQQVSGCIGDKVTLEVSAENAKSYEWQYTYNGGPWTAYYWLDGYKNPKFTMEVKEERAASKIRCAVTGLDGKVVYTNETGIDLVKPVKITKQPQRVNGTLGSKVTLEVAAENAKSYEWQYSYNGGAWTAYYWLDGYKNPKFTMEVNEGRAASRIRCAVTGLDGKVVYTTIIGIDLIKNEQWELPIL